MPSPPDPESLLAHRRFVRAVAGSLLDREQDIDDVEQETWLRALRSAPARVRSPRAWLARVARNLAISKLRARQRVRSRERAGARPDGTPSAAAAASRLEQHRLVVEAVLALDEPFRSVVLLRYYDGLPPREIAASLGIPVATVRSRLRRGMEHMRAWFDARHGGDRKAWSAALLPLAGLRDATAATVVAGSGGKAAAAVVAQGGVMKAKLIALALVVCAAAVGTMAWRAGARAEPGPAPRADNRTAPAARTTPALRTGSAGATTRTKSSAVSRTTGPAEARGGVPPSPGGGPKVVVGRPKAADTRPYRIAEPTADAEHGALRVIVTSPPGVPVSSVSVLVTARTEDTGFETKRHTPGTDGRVEVRGLPPGRATVGAVLGGRHRSAHVELEAGRVVEIEVGFPPGATVTGVVRHIDRGPLPGLSLNVSAKSGGFEETIRATTDSAGRYRLDGVPEGAYAVAISGKFIGYENRPRATLAVAGTAPVARDFVLGQVRLRGVVAEAGTGRPLAGVRLALRAEFVYVEATTDAGGAYAFHDLVAGDYRLALDREGYGHAWIGPVAVPAEGAATCDVELTPAAVLILDVRDGSGRPVPGRHWLRLSPVGRPMTSTGSQIDVDAEGIGRNARIVPGEYTLTLAANGYFPCTQRVELAAGENRLSVRLAPQGEEEEPPVVLEGVVRDAVTGKPLPGVRVQILGPLGSETRTDAEGAYRFHRAPRQCNFAVARDGYGILFVRDIEVTPDSPTHDFEMVPAATLHLRVTDRANRPVVGRLHLGVRGDGEGTTRVGTGVEADADGHAVYRQIVPGAYELRVSAANVGEATVSVEIAPGENIVHVRLE